MRTHAAIRHGQRILPWERHDFSRQGAPRPGVRDAAHRPAGVPLLEKYRPSGAHPLADAALTEGLRRRAEEIERAFAAIEPTLRDLAPRQFEPEFPARARLELRQRLDLEIPEEALTVTWTAPLAVGRLYARCVIATFCRLVAREFDRNLASHSEGESAAALIQRWGFHAIDITPCADGRLSGVVDFILRIPPSVVAFRKSHAGALFPVEESIRHWESVELGRWRQGRPNNADAATRYLKIGVYHFSGSDPDHEGCAAHGHDSRRAAEALLARLEQFREGVERIHGPQAPVAILLVGVDTDNDAIRVHVPDNHGAIHVARCVDNAVLDGQTRGLSREGAKAAIREAVAACAGVADDDGETEGMRWFCGYLLKNNLGQMDAVRAWHGGIYAERGHTERLMVVGDPVDDVQLRNLAFQAQMDTVEEGSADLDVGVSILRRLHGPQGLPVPVLAHCRYDPRIPGSRSGAEQRARRLQGALEARYASLVAAGGLHVLGVVRAGDSADLQAVGPEANPPVREARS